MNAGTTRTRQLFFSQSLRLFCFTTALLLVHQGALNAVNTADWQIDSGFKNTPRGGTAIVVEKPNGKILVVRYIPTPGHSGVSGPGSGGSNGVTSYPYEVIQLLADGRVDPHFQVSSNGSIRHLILQPDGKILIAGRFTTVQGQASPELCRLLADGSRDPDFMPPSTVKGGGHLELQSDGKILISCGSSGPYFDLCRLHSDGQLDTGFALPVEMLDSANLVSVALTPEGKLLIATHINGEKLCIQRLLEDGRLDGSFVASELIISRVNGLELDMAYRRDGTVLFRGGLEAGSSSKLFGLGWAKAEGTSGFFDSTKPEATWPGRFSLLCDGSAWIDYPYTQAPLVRHFMDNRATENLSKSFWINMIMTPLANGQMLLFNSTIKPKSGDLLWRLDRYKTQRQTVQDLSVQGLQQIRWKRVGSLPELSWVTFDIWENQRWRQLGMGSRDGDDWLLVGQNLPEQGQLRASGIVASKSGDGGSGRGIIMQTLSYATPPVISVHPQSQLVAIGAKIDLSVSATGTAPFKYQWRRNGVLLTGAQSSTLIIDSFQTSKSGSYDALITNAGGTVLSQAAQLTLLPAFEILSFPVTTEVTPLESATFSVSAPSGASFQWLRDGRPIAGAKESTLILNQVQASMAGNYSVVVTTQQGKITTPSVQLRVKDRGTYVYQLSGSGVSTTGINRNRATVSGILIFDSVNQEGAFIWQTKTGKIQSFWNDLRKDLTIHTTGPVPGSQMVVTELSGDADLADQVQSSLWLSGTDTWVALSPGDQTIVPTTLSGTLQSLEYFEGVKLEAINLNLTLDPALSAAARLRKESVTQTMERIGQTLKKAGWVETP